MNSESENMKMETAKEELEGSGRNDGPVLSVVIPALNEQDSIADALRLMREKGVRRVPVLTHKGTLAGLLTLDDMLEFAAEELGAFTGAIQRERSHEASLRR